MGYTRLNPMADAMFTTRNVTSDSASVGATSGATFTATAPTVSGYTPIAITRVTTNHVSYLQLTQFTLSGSTLSASVYNRASSAQSTTVSWTVLYAKT